MRKFLNNAIIFLFGLIILYPYTTFAQQSSDFSIDHLTIVVNDLEQARKDFQELGFTIKPGRKHTNSIENAHIKFPDGSALELINATKPTDELAKSYIDLMALGDGPAFLCFGMNDPSIVEELLSEFHPSLTDGGYYQWLTFPDSSALSYLFFMKYTKLPIDKNEHLTHQNGTYGIQSIQLSKSDFASELSVFQTLGVEVNNSNKIILGDQELILIKSANIENSAHPVISITLLVKDIHETLEQLPKGIPFEIPDSYSVMLPKEYGHGIQIVFEQKK